MALLRGLTKRFETTADSINDGTYTYRETVSNPLLERPRRESAKKLPIPLFFFRINHKIVLLLVNMAIL